MGNAVEVDNIDNTLNIRDSNSEYRIVEFKLNLKFNCVIVIERCDDHFTNDLGPKDLDVLIQGLTNLRKQLKD